MSATPTIPTVFVAMPSYDGRIVAESAFAWLRGATRGKCRIGNTFHRGSLLANGFNTLWCEALNRAARGEVNRFAMLHADVVPCDGVAWVDALETILQETDADVVSVVIPIKDRRGLTSTAIGHPDDEWTTVKRLTMTEVCQLPETFTAADAGFPGHPLLVNTGCWLARLDRGNWPRSCWFEIRDRVVVVGQELKAQCLPEDWHFSHQMHRLKVKVVATRSLPVEHVGAIDYTNKTPWGECKVDPLYNAERFPATAEEVG